MLSLYEEAIIKVISADIMFSSPHCSRQELKEDDDNNCFRGDGSIGLSGTNSDELFSDVRLLTSSDTSLLL